MAGFQDWQNTPSETSLRFGGNNFNGQEFQQLEFHETSAAWGHNADNVFQPSPPNNPESSYPYSYSNYGTDNPEEEEEPPLLEELGINPEAILKNTLAVLSPLYKEATHSVASGFLNETDMAGPAAFFVLLAGTLLLTGGQAHFGYVYIIALLSSILMYILVNLMSYNNVPFLAVASVLGYCLLPVVILCFIGIFIHLRSVPGMILTALAVFWCSLSAGRIIASFSNNENQMALIAYPCALLYGTFCLMVVF